MADIELVIKISEEIYQELIKSGYSHLYDEKVADAIANGTPIPRGHGRLIDADSLLDEFEDEEDDLYDLVVFASTIIKADEAHLNG